MTSHDERDKRPLRPTPSAQTVGLGDVASHTLRKLGLKPCSECKRRAAWLNRLVTFSTFRRVPPR